MHEQDPPFGTLLRRAREAAGLTQDGLAQRAKVSARAISDLERQRGRIPQLETLRRLFTTLDLSEDAQATLLEAARRTRVQYPRRHQQGIPMVGAASPVLPPTNLIHPATSFLGREREQEAVRGLCAQARVVTLTGIGGVGKTRLALAVGWSLLTHYPDGVWVVDLAAVTDGALVAQAVLQALGPAEDPERPPLEALLQAARSRNLLLLLDNCEHLREACASVVLALVRQCPDVHILATSRERLRVPGEQRYLVPPLGLPDPRQAVSPAALDAHAAIRLFVDRARSARDTFGVTAHNAQALVTICRRLDGLPLAIELAAARVSSLSVEQIAERLDDRFRLLVGTERGTDRRQQTLRATLDWSYDLLPEAEQRLIRRVAVFADGWTLEAAAAVCADGEGAAWEVLDLLTALIQKSLVQLDGQDGLPRYRVLETVRQYAWEHLQAHGEAAAVQRRHLQWCLALAETEAPPLHGGTSTAWLARLEREQANLRAALDAGLAAGAREEVLRLTAALWPAWCAGAALREGRQRVETALALVETEAVAPALHASLLQGLGALLFEENDYRAAEDAFSEALARYRVLDRPHEVAVTLGNLGKVARRRGDGARARALLDEALALFRTVHDRGGEARTLGNLGSLAYQEGDYDGARRSFEPCLAGFRQLGDLHGTALAVNGLALVALDQGDVARARALLEENLTLARVIGARDHIALALHNLGEVESDQGDYPAARQSYLEALALWRDLGTQGRIADCLEGLARLAALQPESDRQLVLQAARLCGAAAAIRVRIGAPIPPSDQARYAATLDALRAMAGEERCVAALAGGEHLPLDRVLDEVLAAS